MMNVCKSMLLRGDNILLCGHTFCEGSTISDIFLFCSCIRQPIKISLNSVNVTDGIHEDLFYAHVGDTRNNASISSLFQFMLSSAIRTYPFQCSCTTRAVNIIYLLIYRVALIKYIWFSLDFFLFIAIT